MPIPSHAWADSPSSLRPASRSCWCRCFVRGQLNHWRGSRWGLFCWRGALIFGAGLIDDVRGLGAVPKLLIEFLAAAVVMSSGLLIERISLLGFTWSLGWIAWPVTAAWLVGVTNAFNLIDGIDGLAAGITALAGAACCSILIVRGHAPEAMLLAAMVGASLGFLVFNFAPASIFLGDAAACWLVLCWRPPPSPAGRKARPPWPPACR